MIRLFPYYGSKIRAAAKYPAPPKDWTIVEPFAGAAGYSCRYPDRDIHLYDADPVVCGVINHLIKATPNDILGLPTLKDQQTVDDFDLSKDEKALIGFWLNNGVASPAKRLSAWGRQQQDDMPSNLWGERCRARLAKAVEQINHWTCTNASYKDINTLNFDPCETVWFVDPPYMGAGKFYKHPSSGIDYIHLSQWCKCLRGQVIVCENMGANWLPFEQLYEMRGAARGRKKSVEAIWTNIIDSDKIATAGL